MQHIAIHKPGGYDRLRLEEGAMPAPGPGEVLVEVAAIGVNYADCVVRMGLYASAAEYVGWPITPGFELAGRVLATGADVSDMAPGSAVFGVVRFGAYATHVVVPRAQLFERPSGWSAPQAAAFPAVFLTAWYALFRLGAVEPGQRVLVHSAAGGVGGALVQLARLAGAEVTGVVGSPHKVAVARALGADHVVDKSREDLERAARAAAPRGYDLALDANGYATLRTSYALLAPAGRLVAYGFHSMLSKGRGRPHPLRLVWGFLRTPRFDPLRLSRDNKSLLAFNLSFLFDRTELLARAMSELLGWVRDGRLAPPAISAYALADVAAAHRALESGTTTGKLVLLAPGDL